MCRRGLLFVVLISALVLRVVTAADETVLFEKTSQYNSIVVTEDDCGLRTLRFEKRGALQSVVKLGDPDHFELPYAQVVPAGLAFVDRPQRVLIVGLGGGTIPNFFHKHFPQMTIDVVDIDPDVVDVAKKFFGFREDATMHVYVEDGRRFIEKCANPYDIIILDAYGSDNIPFHLATREFLRAVREALTPEGVVVGNVWSSASNPLYDSMVRTYENVFDELYILDVEGATNKIMIALPRKQQIRRGDLMRRAREISTRNHFRFDMSDFFRHGLRRAGDDDSRGRILKDGDEMRTSPAE